MSIFDESEVEASHRRLASTIYLYTDALSASTDLIRKTLLMSLDPKTNSEHLADHLASSVLGSRIVNNVGAASKLIDFGYFTQAAAIFRDIAEVGMLALLFSENPEKLPEWRNTSEKRYKKFGRSTLKKDINDNETFLYFDNYFNVFSEYGTHPSAVSIYFHCNNDTFYIGPHFNEKLYSQCYKDLALLVCRVTDVCGLAYKTVFKLDVGAMFPCENNRFVAAWRQLN